MKKQKQEGALNLLKLLATCIVILHHFQQGTGAMFEGTINFYNGKFYWGRVVELFFILSGYFAYKNFETLDLEKGFVNFWWKKYKRFLPLLFITGLSVILISLCSTVVDGAKFPYNLWGCLGGLFGFGRWFSTSVVVNNPTWYIHILLLCYAVLFFAIFITNRMHLHTASVNIFFMLFGMVMYYVCETYGFQMPFFSVYIARGILCFFLGLLLRELLDRYELHRNPFCVAVCALYVMLFVYLYLECNDYVSGNLYYLLCFSVFPCVIVLFKMEWIQGLCQAPLFSSLSGITYHTYMWHVITRTLFLNIYKINAIPYTTQSAMYLCLAVSFGVGVISWYLEGLISKTMTKKQKTTPIAEVLPNT